MENLLVDFHSYNIKLQETWMLPHWYIDRQAVFFDKKPKLNTCRVSGEIMLLLLEHW